MRRRRVRLPSPTPERVKPCGFTFQVGNEEDLRAFAADLAGSKLPQNHGPWTATGAIGPDKAPPHNFSRAAIEEAIDAEGFQLWRMVKKTEARA